MKWPSRLAPIVKEEESDSRDTRFRNFAIEEKFFFNRTFWQEWHDCHWRRKGRLLSEQRLKKKLAAISELRQTKERLCHGRKTRSEGISKFEHSCVGDKSVKPLRSDSDAMEEKCLELMRESEKQRINHFACSWRGKPGRRIKFYAQQETGKENWKRT